MGKTIILTESQIARLIGGTIRESNEDIPFYSFKFPCMHFIRSLKTDPNISRVKLDQIFTDNGITAQQLERALRNHSVLSSKQRISDEQGDKRAHYVRQYIADEKDPNLEQKLREVWKELFKDRIVETCDAGNSGQFVGKMGSKNAFGDGILNPENDENHPKGKGKPFSIIRRPIEK